MAKKIVEIPQNFTVETFLFDSWFKKTINEFLTYKNELQVLQYRFGLNDSPILVLDDIGIIFDLSRERIRQIEERAISTLSQLVNGIVTRNMVLKNDLAEYTQTYKYNLGKLGQIVNEGEILRNSKIYFSDMDKNLPLIRLLLTILGYKSINLESGVSSQQFAWALGSINTAKIQETISVILNYLRKVVIAKTFDEIKLGVNKTRKAGSRFSDDDLKLALYLSIDIEKIDGDKFQIKYEKLNNIANKAYRILYDANKTMQVRELIIILNKNSIMLGDASRLNPHHMGKILSGDSRFASMGRSGEWFLVEWEGYLTNTILELMEDALHSTGEPLSAKAIFDYVLKKRPVVKKAIDAYLRIDKRFDRVGTDRFALRDWGIESVSYSRKGKGEKIFSKTKLCEYIELVFKTKQLNEMTVTELSQEISNLEPKISPDSLYISIIKSPAVSIKKSQNGRIRNIAVYNPNYRAKLTKLDLLTRDITVGELTQTTVRKILESLPDHQIELANLRDLVTKEIFCPSASVYQSIGKMAEVTKLKSSSNQIICKLNKPYQKFNKSFEQIIDKQLVGEINRALDLVNIDSVDLALFQLGKIFEHTLNRYMLEVQRRNLFTVTPNDLAKLNNMVNWAGKTGLITEETALHYLRIERNDGGHGAPAARDERGALLNNAPTLINFYLDYITLLEQRRERLL